MIKIGFGCYYLLYRSSCLAKASIYRIVQQLLLILSYVLLIFSYLIPSLCYGHTLQNYSCPNNVLKNVEQRKDNLRKTSNNKEDEPPELGNFSLPASQQPGSFVGFGENIYDKGTLQINLGASYLKGASKYSTDMIPSLIYCLTDTSSITLATPYAVRYKEEESRSSGFGDMVAQFEYAFYSGKNLCYVDQATVVTNISFPTGKASKLPSTGFGAPSYFLGATFLRTYVDWFLYTSHGALTTTSHHGTKFGNQFLYQFGIGKNIAFIKDQYVFDWLVELTGQYTGKNRTYGESDPNSGGNVVMITPSLWFSTKHIILKFGVGKPVIQNLFGDQTKNHYVLLGNIAWTF